MFYMIHDNCLNVLAKMSIISLLIFQLLKYSVYHHVVLLLIAVENWSDDLPFENWELARMDGKLFHSAY